MILVVRLFFKIDLESKSGDVFLLQHKDITFKELEQSGLLSLSLT